jgi:DNA polymerase-3 subunit alpha
MSAESENKRSVSIFIGEAKKYDINTLAPDINSSDFLFVAKDKNTIYYGLGGIKGLGEKPAEDIISAREEAAFTSIFDFAKRVESATKKVLEATICAGAFDNLYSKDQRASLFASIELIHSYVKRENKAAESGSLSMFEFSAEPMEKLEPQLIYAEP